MTGQVMVALRSLSTTLNGIPDKIYYLNTKDIKTAVKVLQEI